ncbi:MAG: hypothetical protein ACYCXK_09320, partial [Candidatus Humimicrobiaceae bacterium]
MKKGLIIVFTAIVILSLVLMGQLTGCKTTAAPETTAAAAETTAAPETTAAAAETTAAPEAEKEYKMAFYIPLVHPYHEIVKSGVEDFAKEYGIDVLIQVGTDFTQELENQNVEGIIAKGYNAITMYPVDANGA